MGAVIVRKHRPAIPGPPRLIAALTGEMLGTMAYLQADVLLLAWLTNTTIVGYYTLAGMVVVAVISVGQAFATTYHEPLRHAEGALVGGSAAALHAGARGGGRTSWCSSSDWALLISPAPTQLAVTMMIMSGFAALRIVSWIFQVILYNQRRDLLRFTAAVALVPLKFVLLAALGVTWRSRCRDFVNQSATPCCSSSSPWRCTGGKCPRRAHEVPSILDERDGRRVR